MQYDICSYPCENFYWTASAWSQCSLTEQKSSPVGKCGSGLKTRTIRLVVIHQDRTFFSLSDCKCQKHKSFLFFRCVEKTSHGLEMDLPSHYCDPEAKPSFQRDCRIHCPGECVHSEWTEWSSCHSVLNRNPLKKCSNSYRHYLCRRIA